MSWLLLLMFRWKDLLKCEKWNILLISTGNLPYRWSETFNYLFYTKMSLLLIVLFLCDYDGRQKVEEKKRGWLSSGRQTVNALYFPLCSRWKLLDLYAEFHFTQLRPRDFPRCPPGPPGVFCWAVAPRRITVFRSSFLKTPLRIKSRAHWRTFHCESDTRLSNDWKTSYLQQ